MKSYETFNDFIKSLSQNNYDYIDLSRYRKEGFLEFQLLVLSYNKFRLLQGIKTPIIENKCSWILHKLNVNKQDITHTKRMRNDERKVVLYINENLIKKLYLVANSFNNELTNIEVISII